MIQRTDQRDSIHAVDARLTEPDRLVLQVLLEDAGASPTFPRLTGEDVYDHEHERPLPRPDIVGGGGGVIQGV